MTEPGSMSMPLSSRPGSGEGQGGGVSRGRSHAGDGLTPANDIRPGQAGRPRSAGPGETAEPGDVRAPAAARPVAPKAVSKEAVGALLRAVRKSKGFTLKRLSGESGVPLSTLSKTELGQTALSYDKFMAVSRALEVEISELLQPAQPEESAMFAGQILKASIADQEEYTSDNYLHKFLFSDVRGKVMTPIVATVNSREVADFREFIKHPGQEFAVVLSGSVTILFENGESVHLKRYESAYFDSSIGHVYLTTSKTPARVLAVCSDR